jgi:hypothetical protein
VTPAPERPDQIIAAVRRYGIDSPSLPFELDRILAAAAPVPDAGLREALDEMDRLASFGNGITSSAYRYCADLLRAALSRQAEKETA